MEEAPLPTETLRVCHTSELLERQCEVVWLGGEEVGVWRVQGALHAIGNRCSHKNAKLSLGDIEDLGGKNQLGVKCPKHRGKFGGGLLFSLTDGHSFTPAPRPCSSHKACWAVKPYHAWEARDGTVYVSETPPTKAPPAPVAPPAASTAPQQGIKQGGAARERRHQDIPLRPPEPGMLPAAAGSEEPGSGLWHVSVRSPEGVVREYTPVSTWVDYTTEEGRLDLLVKIYPTGELTGGYLSRVRVGEYLDIGEPEATLEEGEEAFLGETGLALGCVAGGTGITPVMQAVRALAGRQADVSLLYSSRRAADIDILMGEDIAALAAGHADAGLLNFRTVHTLTGGQIPDQWEGKAGRLDDAMLLEHLPLPGPKTKVLVCGPGGMLEAARASLARLGYDDDMVVELDA